MFCIQMFGLPWVKKTKKKKDKKFNGFSIDSDLVSNANKESIVLHCLPAYRDKEITDEVIESKKVEFLNKQKIECMFSKLCFQHFYVRCEKFKKIFLIIFSSIFIFKSNYVILSLNIPHFELQSLLRSSSLRFDNLCFSPLGIKQL